LQAFEARCKITVTGAFPDTPANGIESLQVDYFLRGLPTDIRSSVRMLQPKTMVDAMEKARCHTYLANEGKPKKRKAETLNIADVEGKEPPLKQANLVAEAVINQTGEQTATKAILTLADAVQQNNSSINGRINQISHNVRTLAGNDFHHGKGKHYVKQNGNQNYNNKPQYASNNYRSNGYMNNNYRDTGNNRYSINSNRRQFNNQGYNLNQLSHSTDNRRKKTSRTCFKCGSPDHFIANCPGQDDRYKKNNSSNTTHLNSN
jgi:hypothetical protein